MGCTWGGKHPWTIGQVERSKTVILKGTVLRDFLLQVFFPQAQNITWGHFKFFWKIAEIFISQGAPSVSTTPVANWPPVSMTLGHVLKGQCHEIFDFRCFYESVSTKPLNIHLGPFKFFSKIHGDIGAQSAPLCRWHQRQMGKIFKQRSVG